MEKWQKGTGIIEMLEQLHITILRLKRLQAAKELMRAKALLDAHKGQK